MVGRLPRSMASSPGTTATPTIFLAEYVATHQRQVGDGRPETPCRRDRPRPERGGHLGAQVRPSRWQLQRLWLHELTGLILTLAMVICPGGRGGGSRAGQRRSTRPPVSSAGMSTRERSPTATTAHGRGTRTTANAPGRRCSSICSAIARRRSFSPKCPPPPTTSGSAATPAISST